MSNIIITTPEEAQEAVRLLDDRLAVVEQNVQDLSDRLTQIRNKVKTAIKALQWLAQLHLPADQGGSLRRGSGHVRADAETVAIKELQE